MVRLLWDFQQVDVLDGAGALEFVSGLGSCLLDDGKDGTPSLNHLVGPLDGWVLCQMRLWMEPLLCCTLSKNL